jgi:hypothetical protein
MVKHFLLYLFWFISQLVDQKLNEYLAKGPEGKEDCAASIGGHSFSNPSLSGLPQSAAEA